jgi:hypothetical protein
MVESGEEMRTVLDAAERVFQMALDKQPEGDGSLN